jgi:ankyrin repeat protein
MKRQAMDDQPLNPLVAPAQMMQAARDGHLKRCQKLIAQGADVPSFADSHGRTPLHEAALNGHLAICRLLLENGADPTRAMNDGTTPLHYAAGIGNVEMCRLLVTHGSELRDLDTAKLVSTDSALTPLHCAIINNRVDVLRYFIEECMEDIDQRHKDGRTLEELARAYAAHSVTEFLPSYSNAIRTECAIRDQLPVAEAREAPSRSRGFSPL